MTKMKCSVDAPRPATRSFGCMSELPRTGLYRDAVGGLFLMEQGDHRVLRIPEDGHSPVFYDDYRPAFPVTTAQGVSVTFTED